MLPAILVVTGLFLLFYFTRLGGAYRRQLLARWPAVVLAGAALIALPRMGLWSALGLGALAAVAWVAWPAMRRPAAPPKPEKNREDAQARAILGVGPHATDTEIRAAYRAKMRHAHPDRGGKHSDAARLTAARDQLLKRR